MHEWSCMKERFLETKRLLLIEGTRLEECPNRRDTDRSVGRAANGVIRKAKPVKRAACHILRHSFAA